MNRDILIGFTVGMVLATFVILSQVDKAVEEICKYRGEIKIFSNTYKCEKIE